MKCQEKGCSGEVDMSHPVSLKTGCQSFGTAYSCNQKGCGRLHWKDGSAVEERTGNRAFLKNGDVVNEPATA